MEKHIDYITGIVFIIIILLFFNSFIERDSYVKHTSLKKDGYLVFNNCLKSNVLNSLPNGYEFLDYSYTIKGCILSTFHRDVTSSQYVFNTLHPVYTYIVYYNNGPLLSLCPGSHNTVPLSFSQPVVIYGCKDSLTTEILFNCDVLHAGALSDLNEKRYVIQYKIAHKDDMKKLVHLKGIHKVEEGDCKNINEFYQLFLRKISLMCPYVFNHLFTQYLQEDQKSEFSDLMLKIYGKKFYNK